ncbi:ATP-grasp domain-containing protein [Sorangium sp. So ce1128]
MLIVERPHILVLSSPNQSRLAHFRKLRSLRERFRFTLILERQGLGWEQRFVDDVLPVPEGDVDAVARAHLQRLAAFPGVEGILNLSEACVPIHARLCEALGLRGPSREMVNLGRDKYQMRRFCRDLHIPVPRFLLIRGGDLADCAGLSYPVVLKPALGSSSTLVKRYDSFDELREELPSMEQAALAYYRHDALTQEALRRGGGFPFVVEELIGGEVLYETLVSYPVGELSVESLYCGGRVHVLAMHDKPLPSNGPYFEEVFLSTPTRIPERVQRRAIDYVTRIHERLGDGAYVLHTELRTFAEDLVLLEFGIRMGGGPIYRSVLTSTGHDMIEHLIEIGMGRTPRIEAAPGVPCVTHDIWAPCSGRIAAYLGEPKLVSNPDYAEHQIYDDVGSEVHRAPISSRGSGYFLLCSRSSFRELEHSLLAALRDFSVRMEPGIATEVP